MRPRALIGLLASSLLAAGVAAAAPAAADPVARADGPHPIVSGWFGWWASDEDVRAMASGSDGVVGAVAMFWWSFQGDKAPLCLFDNGDYDKDGSWGECLRNTSTPWTTPRFDKMRQALQSAGIQVNASITDVGSYTAGQLTDYLSTEKRRNAYAKQIADYAVKAGVDGIDLDWENFAFNDGRDTWDATKERWVAFVKVLSEELHANGLTLWATVPGGVPPFSGSGAPNPGTGYWVYAWSDIIEYVDRLNIMTYDYSWDVPGPIGPNDWAQLVAQSAVGQVGRRYADRVYVGVPQYGRSWPLMAGGTWVVDPDCPEGWKATEDPEGRATETPASALEIAAASKVEPEWDAKAGEWHFQYWVDNPGKVKKKAVTCKIKRELWFADTKSALARASFVPDEHIGGIAVWDFGTVQSDFYSKLSAYWREISLAPTKVVVTAPETVVAGRTARVKVKTSSRAGAAVGAKATLYWQPLAGGTGRTKIDTITLDNDGSGVFSVPVERSGSWSVAVEGSKTRSSAESDPVTTRAQFAVTPQDVTAAPKVGTTIVLSAKVTPAAAGTKVTLQRRGTDGTWATVKTVVTDATGMVSAEVRPTAPRTVRFRFVVPATADLDEAISKVLALQVQA